jgi:capsular exopolysaccharide synthesis family protein
VLDIRDYLRVLRQRKWTILVATALVVAGAVAYSMQQTPLYQSQAQVLVKALPLRASGGGFGSVPNLQTERELALSQAVAELAEEEIGDSTASGGSLSVGVATQTEILDISYTHSNPFEAQKRAQAYADAYLTFRRQEVVEDLLASSEAVQTQIQSLDQQLTRVNDEIKGTRDATTAATLQAQANSLVGQIAILQQQLTELTPPENLRVGQVVAAATLPTSPASPNHLTNGLMGLIVGLGLGVGLAFLRERLDDSLRGRSDLEEAAGVPVLAVVPFVEAWRKRKDTLIARIEPRSAAAEAYRTLRTGLLFAGLQRNAKTILVTSSHASEGKTATTANLAVALAQASKRVIVVSADLRKPRLAKFFTNDKTGSPGLSGILEGRAGIREALADTELPNLKILPSGAIPANPAELLGSGRMVEVLQQLASVSDVVLVDGPPVLALADALTLSPIVDGVLFVADAEKTTRGAVVHARQQLEQVDGRLLGAVLNRFDPRKSHGHQYSYRDYYYEHSEKEKEKEESESPSESGPKLSSVSGGRRSFSRKR